MRGHVCAQQKSHKKLCALYMHDTYNFTYIVHEHQCVMINSMTYVRICHTKSITHARQCHAEWYDAC